MFNRRVVAWMSSAISIVFFSSFLIGCSSDKDQALDLKGKIVTIFGPEVAAEGEGLLNAFKPFEERTGIDVQYQGDRSFEQQIGSRVSEGNAPDIAMFPQPGKVKDFREDLKPLPSDIVKTVKKNFDSGWTNLVTIDKKLYGIPVKADLKSLVWYSPKAFKDGGYQIPTSFEDFLSLADKMLKDSKTPFCVGIGSDASTGWPFTDWMEDWMLRMKGPDFYDKWVNHQVPFDDKEVIEVGQAIQDLWSKPGMIYGGEGSVSSTLFADAGLPLLENKCLMYRMANFYGNLWPKGTKLGDDGDVSAFYLPGNEKFGRVTLSAGIYANPFSDRPEVIETMHYMASTEFANLRAPINGFLSPNKNTDKSKYPTEIERSFAEILAQANPVRFDASDLMPGTVGAGTFWTAAVDIANGTKDVPTAFRSVEVSWPR